MRQKNQNSLAMCLRKLFAFCFVLMVSSSAWADDYLTAYVKPGDTKQLSIKLKNATDYTAFQMTIKLPEGLEFADSDPVLTSRKQTSHQFHFNKVDAKTMKVVAFSFDESLNTGNEAFNNDKAEILLLDVNVTDAAYNANNIELSDIEFVDKNDLSGKTLAVTSKGKLGDVDNNNTINTVDASLILMKLVDKSISGTYNEEAEDVDGNGQLNTVDASEVLKETLRK